MYRSVNNSSSTLHDTPPSSMVPKPQIICRHTFLNQPVDLESQLPNITIQTKPTPPPTPPTTPNPQQTTRPRILPHHDTRYPTFSPIPPPTNQQSPHAPHQRSKILISTSTQLETHSRYPYRKLAMLLTRLTQHIEC